LAKIERDWGYLGGDLSPILTTINQNLIIFIHLCFDEALRPNVASLLLTPKSLFDLNRTDYLSEC